MPDNELELVTLAAMASKLRIRPQELRREVEQGRLPAVRIGQSSLLFDPTVVERLLAARAAEAAAANPGDPDDH